MKNFCGSRSFPTFLQELITTMVLSPTTNLKSKVNKLANAHLKSLSRTENNVSAANFLDISTSNRINAKFVNRVILSQLHQRNAKETHWSEKIFTTATWLTHRTLLEKYHNTREVIQNVQAIKDISMVLSAKDANLLSTGISTKTIVGIVRRIFSLTKMPDNVCTTKANKSSRLILVPRKAFTIMEISKNSRNKFPQTTSPNVLLTNHSSINQQTNVSIAVEMCSIM